MSGRPYIQKTSAELQALFESAKSDAAVLKRIADELKHRRVPTARVLAKKIDHALTKLSAGSAPQPGASQEKASSTSSLWADQPSCETKPAEERIVSCKGCGARVRVQLVEGTHRMRCPGCKAEFTAAFENNTFSVTFEIHHGVNGKENGRLTLEDAYRLFDADQSTPWEQIEKARRKLIQQYHPDKVASLGPKLREVAEAQGKRINQAFDLVRAARGLQ